MTPEALLKATRAQRAVWHDLEPGKRVQITRPREDEVVEFFIKPQKDGHPDLPTVRRFVVGWEGFTEADFLGAAGASSPVPFHPDLWDEWISDHLAMVPQVADMIRAALTAHLDAKAEAEKNSPPSSTPPTARSGTESSQ